MFPLMFFSSVSHACAGTATDMKIGIGQIDQAINKSLIFTVTDQKKLLTQQKFGTFQTFISDYETVQWENLWFKM